MRHTHPALIAFICLLLTLTSCVKDKPAPDSSNQGPKATTGRRVFIANEGSLGNGNSDLSVYDIDHNLIVNEVFSETNKQALGDVFQSITALGDRLFLAINNSDKIVVINKNDYRILADIQVRKPRFMLPVSTHKMYVSSIFYPEINIVDPVTYAQTGKITVDYPNTEGLTMLQGDVYACNWDTACNYIYKINPQNDQITERIPIAGYAPQTFVIDKQQQLWVLAGNSVKKKNASWTQINPATGSIVKSYQFPADADILKPVLNPTKDTVYFLGVNYNGGTSYNGVYRMALAETPLHPELLIPAQPLQYFWGLGVDSVTGRIYVGDPKGFIQAGSVSIYESNGDKITSFTTTLGPGFFYFE